MKKKSLLIITTFTLLLCLINQFVKAQIIYTDIRDVVLSAAGSTYPLDLNNDGVVDFNLSISGKTYKSQKCGTITVLAASISTLGQNKVLTNQLPKDNTNYPTVLNLNSSISSSSITWKGGGSLILISHNNVNCDFQCLPNEYGGGCDYVWHLSTEGQWGYTTDKYLGLQIRSGGKDYYGWVRLSTLSYYGGQGSLTIKDYAYNASLSQLILAGQVATEYITTPIVNLYACSERNIGISYNAYGNFSASNSFYAELSDAGGSFSNPIVIGTQTGTTSGIINATLPANVGTENGTYYKIRIKSTSPIRLSNENNISISSSPQWISILAYPTSNPPASYDDPVIIYCSGYLVASAGAYGSTLQWKLNSSDISGATQYIYYPSASGDYTCNITNSCGSKISNTIHAIVNSCPSSRNKKETFTQNEVQIPGKDFAMKIYPNPAFQLTTILFSVIKSGKVSIKIFDMTGRLVKMLANKEMQLGQHQIIWNIQGENGSNVPPGIYLVKIETTNFSETKKLIVVR